MSLQQAFASPIADCQIKGKIGIVSCILDDWGGSEELWARSIPTLQQNGFEVVFFRKRINKAHPNYITLASNRVLLEDIDPESPEFRSSAFKKLMRLNAKVLKKARKVIPIISKTAVKTEFAYEPAFVESLKAHKPNLIIISQGINFDGLHYAYLCQKLNIPYITISQKAVEFYWPRNEDRAIMSSILMNARKNYFVSHSNHQLTEEQFGLRLNNAEVVHNPVKKVEPVAYPSTEKGYKLACIGRLFIIDKGQDILLRIMAQPKWKNRLLTISFIGVGPDQEGLMKMAKLLNVNNIEFKGFVEDARQIWKECHALVLPSRSEGLPLVLVEAMAAARTAIITDAGGSTEVMQDGITGFIGQANMHSFEAALDKAWENRDQWEEMGKRASFYINSHLPESPETLFAESIINTFYEI